MICFSYSRLSCYKQCPLKYKYHYIDKIEVKTERAALIKGSKIHSILENIETFEYNPQAEHHNIVNNFAKSEIGSEILSRPSIREHCIKLNENLEADDSLTKKTARMIGYIDRVNTTENGVDLIDYKTGKYKDMRWQDFEQLGIYGIYMFSKFPQLNELNLRYVYVEHAKENTKVLTREESDIKKITLKAELDAIENQTHFAPKKQVLCDWCDFKNICEAHK